MKNKLLVFLACLLLIPLIAGAQEYTQTVEDSTGGLLTEWNEIVQVPKFDPSLGVLLEAKLTIQVSSKQTIRVENTSENPANMNVNGRIEIAAQSPIKNYPTLLSIASTEYFDYTAYDGVLDYNGDSGEKFDNLNGNGGSYNQDSFEETYTSASDLAHFIGLGTFDVSGATSAFNEVTGFSGTVSVLIESRANMSVTVAYKYIQPADLELSKSVNEDEPVTGEVITYTITVNNQGPFDADDVKVEDQLPSGLKFVSANSANYNSNSGVWSVGHLDVSGSASLEIQARVVDAGSVITNSAEVTVSNRPDPDSTPDNDNPHEDDQDDAPVTPVAISDLELNKTVNNSSPSLGANIIYTISVTNQGPDDAHNVQVTDNLPNGLRFVSSNGNYSNGVWDAGTVSVNQTKTLQITAKVIGTGSIDNSAEVTLVNERDPDSDPDNNIPTEDDQDNEPIDVPLTADLELNKSASIQQGRVGETFDYTLTIHNNGPDMVTDVTVEDALPNGVSLNSSSASQGTLTGSTWYVGPLANNATVTLTLNVTITATTGTITNYAQIESSNLPDPDSTPGDDSTNQDDDDDVDVEVIQRADIEVEKALTNPDVGFGEQAIYIVTVSNKGPDDATNIVISESIPSGLANVNVTCVTGTWNNSTNRWTIPSLAYGDSEILTITGTINTVNEICNTASLVSLDQIDTNPGNNSAEFCSTAEPLVDISLEKSVEQPTYNVGDQIHFTLVARNSGPSTAHNVKVEDVLPPELTYINATGNGSYSSSTNTWTISSIGVNQTRTLHLYVRATVADIFMNIIEVAACDEPDSDSTPGNGDTDEDDYATVHVMIEPSIDLQVEKTSDKDHAALGETTTFTVTVTANEKDSHGIDLQTANNVVVTDAVPANFIVATATPSVGSYNNGVWTVGSLDPGASATLNLEGTSTVGGSMTNSAQVTSCNEHDIDSTPNNNNPQEDDQDDASVQFGVVDVSLQKTGDPGEVYVGDTVTFTINVHNAGPDPATSVQVEDVLPSQFTFSSSDGAYNTSTNIWTVGTLGRDAMATLNIQAVANTKGIFTNSAEVVVCNEYDSDSTPDNNVINEDDQDGTEIIVVNTGSIGDRVWADYNGDGVQDAEEPGIPNVQVQLTDENEVVIATHTTDQNGNYPPFTGLKAGEYTVEVIESTVPARYHLTTGNNPMVVNLEKEENFLDADFGYQPEPSKIGDYVWQDLDWEGDQDQTEDGLDNITVNLRQNGQIIASTQTDANGYYEFPGLYPARYGVDVDETTIPNNWMRTTPTQNGIEINLQPLTDYLNADFGYAPEPASIGDLVWYDMNEDGIVNNGDYPMSNVTVRLLDQNGTEITTTVTNNNGLYTFNNLLPGTYQVTVNESTVEEKHHRTTPTETFTVTLVAGQNYVDADFGYAPNPGQISGIVWIDNNENQQKEREENPMQNVVINLIDDNGTIIKSTTSGPDGSYTFTDVRARYPWIVSVDRSTVWDDYWLTTSSDVIPVNLEPEEHKEHVDFGYMRHISAIGDYIWDDANKDGIQDAGETPLSNILVILLDENGKQVAKTLTDAHGHYLFKNVAFGNFTVVVDASTLPENYSLTTSAENYSLQMDGQSSVDWADFGYAWSRSRELENQDVGVVRELFAWYEPWYGDAQKAEAYRHWNADVKGGIADSSLFGEFDSQMERVWEYDIMTAWSVGIDAFIVEWTGDAATPEACYETTGLLGLLDKAAELNQQLEDIGFEFYIIVGFNDSTEADLDVKMQYLGEQILTHDGYYGKKAGTALPLFIYHDKHSAAEIRVAVDQYLPIQRLLAWNEGYDLSVFSNMDLLYPWVQPMNKEWQEDGSRWGNDYLDFEYENMNQADVYFAIGAAWPGFDDRAWSEGENRFIDPQDTLVYHQTWQKIHNYAGALPMPWAVVESWNDFNRNTPVDATLTFGNALLRMTREHAKLFKGVPELTTDDDLAIIALQHIRAAQATLAANPQDSYMLEAALEQAFDCFTTGEFYKAISVVDLVTGIAPNALNISFVDAQTIQLSWEASPYAAGYELHVADNASAFSGTAYPGPTVIQVGSETSYTLSDADLSQPLFIALAPISATMGNVTGWYQNIYTHGTIYELNGEEINTIPEPAHQAAQETAVVQVPDETKLAQNYPNPFNPVTTISYSLHQDTQVHLTVYNTLGRVVADLVNEAQAAGHYQYNWDASQLPSGVYLYTLKTDNYIAKKRMLLIK